METNGNRLFGLVFAAVTNDKSKTTHNVCRLKLLVPLPGDAILDSLFDCLPFANRFQSYCFCSFWFTMVTTFFLTSVTRTGLTSKKNISLYFDVCRSNCFTDCLSGDSIYHHRKPISFPHTLGLNSFVSETKINPSLLPFDPAKAQFKKVENSVYRGKVARVWLKLKAR